MFCVVFSVTKNLQLAQEVIQYGMIIHLVLFVKDVIIRCMVHIQKAKEREGGEKRLSKQQ